MLIEIQQWAINAVVIAIYADGGGCCSGRF